jgi:hypothetical protein
MNASISRQRGPSASALFLSNLNGLGRSPHVPIPPMRPEPNFSTFPFGAASVANWPKNASCRRGDPRHRPLPPHGSSTTGPEGTYRPRATTREHTGTSAPSQPRTAPVPPGAVWRSPPRSWLGLQDGPPSVALAVPESDESVYQAPTSPLILVNGDRSFNHAADARAPIDWTAHLLRDGTEAAAFVAEAVCAFAAVETRTADRGTNRNPHCAAKKIISECARGLTRKARSGVRRFLRP